MVRSPLTAARATFALKAGEWFRRGRLLMVSPVHGDYRRYQAETPLIALSKFPRPALISKALGQHVEFLNGWAEFDSAPKIELAPLPSRAQFLNVIESVFSGMSRAIIHNSDFENASQAMEAIDAHFANRNEFYRLHRKRAGRKLWGQERSEAGEKRGRVSGGEQLQRPKILMRKQFTS
jgi:hypothetical protein